MRMIFVNLPVKDLTASTRFFTQLGRRGHRGGWETVAADPRAGPDVRGSFQDLDGHVWELMYMEQR